MSAQRPPVPQRSLGDALEWTAEHLDFWAGRGEGVVSLRERMRTTAFALRVLAAATPGSVEAAGAPLAEAAADDLDAYVREQAAQDPAFAAEYVRAQHAARIRAFEDLLGVIELHIDWRHVAKQLTTGQKNLFTDSVDAWCARIAGDDEPSGADRWWDE